MQNFVSAKVLVEIDIDKVAVNVDNDIYAYNIIRDQIMNGGFIDFCEDKAIVKEITNLKIADINQVEFKEFNNLLERVAYTLERVFERVRMWARFESGC
jgi:hypothetical protein